MRRRCYLKHQLRLGRIWSGGATSGFSSSEPVTYQIRSRNGLCMAQHDDNIALEQCGDASIERQRWQVDLRLGQIKAKDGQCMGSPAWKVRGGVVRLRPCLEGANAQHWFLEGRDGLIKNSADFCVGETGHTPGGKRLQMETCGEVMRGGGGQWSLWLTSALRESKAKWYKEIEVDTTGTPLGSLFCYSLMLPYGNEQSLMTDHARNWRGIFQCEEAAVYSSVMVNLANGFTSQVVPGTDLHVERGGKWGTYMNTPVFVAVWNQVHWHGRYKYHSWTVKADPDAAFFPQRLREKLLEPEFREAEIKTGIVIDNCDKGLHGPLEVLSRRAMEVFGQSRVLCKDKPQEDYYLSSCLDTLGVDVHFRQDLLADQGCNWDNGGPKDPDWFKCQSGHAAFHPFKTPADLQGCYSRASM